MRGKEAEEGDMTSQVHRRQDSSLVWPCYQLCDASLEHSSTLKEMLKATCQHGDNDDVGMLMFSRCNF